jgi:hypothetical protein
LGEEGDECGEDMVDVCELWWCAVNSDNPLNIG